MAKDKRFVAPFAEQGKFQADDFSAPVIDVLERKVRFSLKHCDTGKSYCISTFASDKQILSDLYKRLGHFEDMTWQLAKNTNHASAISIEKRSSTNYRNLVSVYGDFDTFGHLRIPSSKKKTFRVFGALREDLFYILRFDVNGSINH